MYEIGESVSHSVVSDSLLPHGLSHGVSQARILEWVAISSARGSSWSGIEPRSPALQADSLPFETGSTITKKGVMSIKFVL